LFTVRRCNFHRCPMAIGSSGSGPCNIFEDCLIVECGASWEDIIMQRRANNQTESASPLEFKGDATAHIVRYNTVADNHGGLWYDGQGTGNRVLGNAFWDNKGQGIYNEYSADDTLVMGNYFLHDAVQSSYSTRLSVVDNFFDGGRVVWGCHDRWPFRNSYMIMRGNALIDLPQGYLGHYGSGWGPSQWPQNFRNCLVDYNRFRMRPGVACLDDADTNRAQTIEEVRARYGWDIHGEGGVYNPTNNDLTPEAMGGSVVTYRVPWGPRAHLARPMLSDAGIDSQWPCAVEMNHDVKTPSFFWRVADGAYDPRTLWNYQPWWEHDSAWQPCDGGMPRWGSPEGENHGCAWYVGAEKVFGTGPDGTPVKIADDDYVHNVSSLSQGNRWLVMKALAADRIPAQGVGYWTPWLATATGAKITVALKLRGTNLVSTAAGSPAVWLQFINATGQHRQRVFVVGRDGQGVLHGSHLTDGSYDWTNIQETITAPEGAIRMALFMGVTPCVGEVNFDDINLTTESAPAPATAEPQEALPPRLPLERIKETFFVDLTKVANRALADEADNDGKGGWSDQGPSCDMRALKTGERKFGGVPFKILEPPRSIVVLKSAMRVQGDLPAKIVIPVGRKVDRLFFLHACAWTAPEGQEAFRYVLHFKDGAAEPIPVIAGQRVTDWAREPVRRFLAEEGTFTTVAESVPSQAFGKGSVYRMEWSCPVARRGGELESIEFTNDGQSVPMLLGITGVIEW
jgi:hypothetical protein